MTRTTRPDKDGLLTFRDVRCVNDPTNGRPPGRRAVTLVQPTRCSDEHIPGGEPPLHTAVLRNETAAAVSLHVGIPVLMAGFALWVWPRSPLAWLLLLYPATVFLVVLGTGNHYVLDALVGIACVAFGAGVARAVHGVAPRGSPSTSRRETAGVAVGVVLAALVANALFRGELP